MLTHAAGLALAALWENVAALDRDSVANGTLDYEARISKVAPLIDDALKQFISFALGRARHSGRDFGAYELARLRAEQLCTTIQADLPLMLVVLGDSETAGRKFPWGVSARLFGRLRGGLKAAFQIAAQDFRHTPEAASSGISTERQQQAGHLTLPHNYIGLADALLELTTALLKLNGRDCDGVYLDNAKQSQQTESDRSTAHRDAQKTSMDTLVKSMAHRMDVPPLEVWTRESPHRAPEQIDHRRLAISHSMNWEKTLATGHLAVGDDGLAPLNGWPLYVSKGPWSAFLAAILKTLHHHNRPTRPTLSSSALNAWWNSMKKQRDKMTQAKLLDAARNAHPQHLVPRERIRELSAGRKRGRKPIGG